MTTLGEVVAGIAQAIALVGLVFGVLLAFLHAVDAYTEWRDS